MVAEAWERVRVAPDKAAGCDEAGRGPLAGNVIAAAVILDHRNLIEGLADSKKLSQKKREALYESILSNAIAVGVGSASPQEIDEINILQASLLAMTRAVDALPIRPDFVFVDGNWYLVIGLCMWPLCGYTRFGYTQCLQLQASSPAGGVDEEMGELPHYV